MTSSRAKRDLEALAATVANERLAKNWPQAHLAEESGISVATLRRLESGKSVQLINWLRVLHALGLAQRLAPLLQPAAKDPIQELEFDLQRKRKQRQRASAPRKPKVKRPWTWGEDQ